MSWILWKTKRMRICICFFRGILHLILSCSPGPKLWLTKGRCGRPLITGAFLWIPKTCGLSLYFCNMAQVELVFLGAWLSVYTPLGLHLCFGNKRRRHISSLNMRNKVIVMFITSKRFPTNRTKGTILRANNGWIRVITVIRRRHKRIVYNTEPKPHPYIKNKHTKKELPK